MIGGAVLAAVALVLLASGANHLSEPMEFRATLESQGWDKSTARWLSRAAGIGLAFEGIFGAVASMSTRPALPIAAGTIMAVTLGGFAYYLRLLHSRAFEGPCGCAGREGVPLVASLRSTAALAGVAGGAGVMSAIQPPTATEILPTLAMATVLGATFYLLPRTLWGAEWNQ